MEANELRLGNLVTYDSSIHTIEELYSIDSGCVTLKDHDPIEKDSGEIYCTDLYGIPITEELLLKNGFEKINHINGNSFYSLKRKVKRHFINKIPSIRIHGTYTMVGSDTVVYNLDYLHQLQNLYFALTNTEFEFKL